MTLIYNINQTWLSVMFITVSVRWIIRYFELCLFKKWLDRLRIFHEQRLWIQKQKSWTIFSEVKILIKINGISMKMSIVISIWHFPHTLMSRKLWSDITLNGCISNPSGPSISRIFWRIDSVCSIILLTLKWSRLRRTYKY